MAEATGDGAQLKEIFLKFANQGMFFALLLGYCSDTDLVDENGTVTDAQKWTKFWKWKWKRKRQKRAQKPQVLVLDTLIRQSRHAQYQVSLRLILTTQS